MWLCTLLILCVAVAYANSLQGSFVFDDTPNIVAKKNLEDVLGEIMRIPSVATRSTTRITFAATAATLGRSPLGFHFGNLLIHLISVVVLFELVRGSIQRWQQTHDSHLNANLVGFVAALLWGIHPLGTMAVTYIVQRHESLMAMFYLLTLYLLLRGTESNRPWAWYLGSITCCWVGMGAKEIMVTIPLVAILFDYTLLSSNWSEPLKRRWWVHLLFIIPAVLLFVDITPAFSSGTGSNTAVFGANETATPWLYIWTQSGVILHYIRLSFWPDYLTFDYDWPVANSPNEYLWPAITIWTILGLSFWLLFKRPPIGFVALSFFFVLAPTSSVIPIVDVAFEHRMYLPLASLCVLLAIGLSWGIAKWQKNDSLEIQYATIFLIAIVLAIPLGMRTIYRNADYVSEIALWKSVVQSRPSNLRANHNLAQELRKQDRVQEAEQHLLDSIAYCEQHGYETFTLHGDLAELYVYVGRFDQALKRFQTALDAADHFQNKKLSKYRQLVRDRQLAETRTSYGALLNLLGNPLEAAEQFDLAIELRPDVANWYVMSGDAHRKAGHLQIAVTRWKRALKMDRSRKDVRRDYALLLAENGDYEQAASHLQKIAQEQPDDVAVKFQLARIHAAAPMETIRAPSQAIAASETLMKSHSQFAAEIASLRVLALGNSGQFDAAIEQIDSLLSSTPKSDQQTTRQLNEMRAHFKQHELFLLSEMD